MDTIYSEYFTVTANRPILDKAEYELEAAKLNIKVAKGQFLS